MSIGILWDKHKSVWKDGRSIVIRTYVLTKWGLIGRMGLGFALRGRKKKVVTLWAEKQKSESYDRARTC